MSLAKLEKSKSMKGLPGIGGKRKQEPLPSLGQQPQRVQGMVDDALARLTQELQDEQLAKKVLKLKEKFPDGTIPELIVMEWLDRRGFEYRFQMWVLGGRVLKGGQVLDFAVDLGIRTLILEVQGRYWHTRPGKMEIDEGQKLALLGLEIFGKRVGAVVEVWDTRLLDKKQKDRVMNLAIAGVEVGI